MNAIISSAPAPDFDLVIDAVLNGLGSERSKRIYSVTYAKWATWCEGIGLNPFELNGSNVVQFLKDQPSTKTTRSGHLSHLRKIVQYLSIYYEGYGRLQKELSFVKVPTEGIGGHERSRAALRPEQVYKLLKHWDTAGMINLRNRAMIALALATGARRSELVALTWDDINLEDGIVTIRHGKGDKFREVALVGDFVVPILKRWRYKMGRGFVHVFVPINKAGRINSDKAIDTTTLYHVFQQTSIATGVEFSPHDTRRTLATELFITGAMTSDVQAQLGHADASTTMGYALAGSAIDRRKRFRTRWSAD